MKTRVLSIFLCVFAIVALLTGCAREDEDANVRIEAMTRGMVDAILADDCAAAYTYVKDATTEEAFLPVYEEMREMLRGVESYTLEKLDAGKSESGYALSVKMTATGERGTVTYAIKANEVEGKAGLGGFYLQENATVTGTLTKMGEADARQWCTLLFGALSWVVTVAALLDCFLHAKENRGMMLIIILLGMVTLSFTVAPSFSFSLGHGYTFPYTAFLYFSTGTKTLKLFLPLGALGYLIFRRKFVPSKTKE